MICLRHVKAYCKDYENIENYELAVHDTETWICHHRLENTFTAKELAQKGMYYNVSADELIFLRKSEHQCNPELHISLRKYHKTIKGRQLSDETRAKMSAAHKGKKHCTGMRWFNDGIKNIRAKECPKGFVPGRIK